MTRLRALLLASVLATSALAAQNGAQQKAPPATSPEPAEEDESLKPAKQYAFNPVQAEKELRIGDFYFKKGSWQAAAGRFKEATKWNPNFAEAYLRLGEAQEKLKNPSAARQAFRKFLDLAPNDKRAGEIKKKLAGKG